MTVVDILQRVCLSKHEVARLYLYIYNIMLAYTEAGMWIGVLAMMEIWLAEKIFYAELFLSGACFICQNDSGRQINHVFKTWN